MENKQAEELRKLIIELVRLETKITKAANFERGHKTLSTRFDNKAKKIAKLLGVDVQKFVDDLNI